MSTKQYRCRFTDTDDKVQTTEQIACENDAAALLEVERLMASSQFISAELWDGSRLVGKWDHTRPDTNRIASLLDARTA